VCICIWAKERGRKLVKKVEERKKERKIWRELDTFNRIERVKNK